MMMIEWHMKIQVKIDCLMASNHVFFLYIILSYNITIFLVDFKCASIMVYYISSKLRLSLKCVRALLFIQYILLTILSDSYFYAHQVCIWVSQTVREKSLQRSSQTVCTAETEWLTTRTFYSTPTPRRTPVGRVFNIQHTELHKQIAVCNLASLPFCYCSLEF